MSFTLLSVAIALIFAVICVICVSRGMRKGLNRSLISLATVVLSLMLSLMLTPLISVLIARGAYWAAKSLYLGRVKQFTQYLDLFPSLESLIIAVVGIALSTVLFVAVFYALRGIIGTIASKLCMLGKTMQDRNPDYRVEKNSYLDKHSKSLGAVIGVVTAILITMVITCPIMGTLDVATDCLDIATQAYSKVNKYVGQRNYDAVYEYSNDALGNAFYQFGGKLMYRSVASSYLDGDKIYLMPELENASEIASSAIPLYYNISQQKYDAKTQVTYINDICAGLEKTRACDAILADGTRVLADKWINGRSFFGVARPETNELVDPFLNEIFEACAQSTTMNVKQNVSSVLQILAVVIESDVLNVDTNDYDQVIQTLEESDLLAKLDDILQSNPSMRHISTSTLVMRAISTHVLTLDFDPGEYEMLTDDIADAINSVNLKGYGSDEERAEALALHAIDILKDYNVDVSEDTARMAAKELLTLYPEIGQNVSAEQVRNLLEAYAQNAQ